MRSLDPLGVIEVGRGRACVRAQEGNGIETRGLCAMSGFLLTADGSGDIVKA